MSKNTPTTPPTPAAAGGKGESSLSAAALQRLVVPGGATAALILSDGSVFFGQGAGAAKTTAGEICFNTAMTGYQEILTDPSYAGQIITFTFPHIGNVGTNEEDIEAANPAARGAILREAITPPANHRAQSPLDSWLKGRALPAITGVDTRRLTRRLRERGALNGVLCHEPSGNFDLAALYAKASSHPGLEGQDLAETVSCSQSYEWDEGSWALGRGYARATSPRFHVVAVDFGAKRNILRSLAASGCKVSVVPARTTAEEILARKPNGVFLSNGPGDPAATGHYAVPMIRGILESGLPLFGICLGHQMLSLALGAKTVKMHHGHRGANHPVKDMNTGKVEITSQNHGFMVDAATLPAEAEVTHVSLFDGTLEGIALKNKPVFSVQYHPEASPGPHDSHYLFARFAEMMANHA